MAIILSLGNIGSGKTACIVREMVQNRQRLKYYTNVQPSKPTLTPWINRIHPEMIIKKEHVRDVKKKSGVLEPVYEFKLNKEYWQNIKEPITVVLDEIHTLMNPRRAMSKVNVICTDWLAMLRRVIGENPQVQGDLIMITQLGRRTDVIAREMVHQVRYHVCHYIKTCNTCKASFSENSEVPEPLKVCPYCGDYRLNKSNFSVEIKHFAGIESFNAWKDFGMKSYHRHYFVTDIQDYFRYYNTLQWEDMFSSFY